MIRTCATAWALVLLCGGPAAAQGFGIGAKGGVNLATQRIERDGEERTDLTTRVGMVAGVFATLPVTSWFDVQSEALYTSKGGRLDLDGVKASVAVDYLEVPVLARLSRRGPGGGRYYAAAGPSIAFRLRSRSRTSFGSATEEVDLGEDIEALDYGFAAGGGIEIGRLVFDGRYTFGLKDIDKDDSATATNRALSITAGFRF